MLTPCDIRKNLRDWVSRHLSSDPSDVMIDELGFVNQQDGRSIDCSFRADLALANGRLVGFEIKSGADSLKRWKLQCEAYFNVFDEVWLCTHGKHLEKALSMTPKSAGILLVDDFGGVAMLREAKKNSVVRPYDLTGLLWRDELDDICAAHGVTVKRRETKAEVRAKVSEEVSIELISKYVLSRLKERRA